MSMNCSNPFIIPTEALVDISLVRCSGAAESVYYPACQQLGIHIATASHRQQPYR